MLNSFYQFILRNVILSVVTLALYASAVRISEIIVETLRYAQGIMINLCHQKKRQRNQSRQSLNIKYPLADRERAKDSRNDHTAKEKHLH